MHIDVDAKYIWGLIVKGNMTLNLGLINKNLWFWVSGPATWVAPTYNL